MSLKPQIMTFASTQNGSQSMNRGEVFSLRFHYGMSQVHFGSRVRTRRDSKTFSTVKDILQIFETTLDRSDELLLEFNFKRQKNPIQLSYL